jgi:type I restriction enzyme S subunit
MGESLDAVAEALFLGRLDEAAAAGSLREAAFGDVAELLRETVDPQVTPNDEFLHFSLPAYDNGRQPVLEHGSAIRSIKSIVPDGSVLLSKLNPDIARVWLPDVADQGCAVSSTEFLVLQPRAPFGRAFLYGLAKSSRFRRELVALATGTSNSHQRARPDGILAIPVVVPDERWASAYEREAGPVLSRVASCEREARSLKGLRDLLLPRLISGDLPVVAAERAIEAVAR